VRNVVWSDWWKNIQEMSQGCSEKEMSRKMGMKQLISSPWQCTCTSVVNCYKVLCQAQCEGFGASTIFPRLITPWLFLFLWLWSVLKGKQFMSAEEVAANATTALTEALKNCF
jgi:hypothetical protein